MPEDELTLDEYQRRALLSDVLPQTDAEEDRLLLPLLGLAGEIGALASEWKKRRRDITGYRAFTDEVREELGDVLWYAAALADRTGLRLSEIAEANLRKTQDSFLIREPLPPHALYDEDRPEEEQLPRRLAVIFRETTLGRGSTIVPGVTVYMADEHGTQVGDPLDDNSDEDDDYRYHDVFHLAYMAVLGWSPVMRATLRPKRKRRDGRSDRVEDGGRAISIEEGVSAAVFSEARGHSYFATADRVPGDLVKSCMRMTSHLEVASRTTGDWQYAIKAGYRVFNYLVEHREALVVADLTTRILTATPIPEAMT